MVSAYQHITAITASTSAERQQALLEAGTTAVSMNNEAVQLSASGNHRAASELHLRVLAIKIKAYSLKSIQAGITLNALGEEYLALGELDEAEAVLKMALEAREAAQGQEFDAAVTRENLGRVYERKGNWAAARTVRAEGGSAVCCSNYKCPGQTFDYASMKRCSACQAPVYCGAMPNGRLEGKAQGSMSGSGGCCWGGLSANGIYLESV